MTSAQHTHPSSQRRNYSRGISMLEFALTLPLLLFTTLAAVDITAVLQARSAMQQATTTSLRCVYPVDGVCNSVRGDTRERFYEFFLLPDSSDGFIFSREDFSGRARFFRAPRRELTDFRAPRLGSVYYDFNRSSYHVSGTIPGFTVPYRVLELLGELPRLSGSDPRNPRFRIASNGSDFPSAPSSSDPLAQRVQIAAQKSGSGTSLSLAASDTLSNWQTAYTVTIPSPELRSLCTGAGCENLSGARSLLAFHLKGTAHSSETNGCGSVELRLRSGSGFEDELGGQDLGHLNGGSESRNFYPRGIADDDVEPELQQYREWQHGHLEVEFNRPYQIQVRLRRNLDASCNSNAVIGWQATSVSLYTPVFRHRANRFTACRPRVPDGTIPRGIDCIPEVSGVLPEFYAEEPSLSADPALHTTVDTRVPAAYSPAHATFLVLQDSLGAALVPPEQSSALGSTLMVSEETPQSPRTFSQECPQNPAVTEVVESVPGESPPEAIRNSSRALQLCGPVPEQISEAATAIFFGAALSNVRWSETASQPISHPAVPWTKTDCTVTPPEFNDLPGELQEYPQNKLTWSDLPAQPPFEIVTTGRELEGNPLEDPHDPIVLKRTDPRYACAELSIGSFVYDDSNPQVSRSSLFVGIHDNIDACDRGAVLREAAESPEMIPSAIRLLPDMFFSPGTGRAVQRVETAFEPQNSCTAYQIRQGQTVGLGERVPGGPYPEGITPPACSQDAACRRLFSHFGDGDAGGAEILSERAAELGRAELYAAAPWLARSCGTTPCGNIEIMPDSPTEGTVTAIARAEVPLTALLGGSISLEHTHRERLETELLERRAS